MSNNDNNDTNLPEPSSTPAPEINSNGSTAVVDGEQSRNDTPPDPEPSAGTLSRRTSTADAQAQVIASLREQVQDLFSQVTQLNNKLVKSYDRVSDLEDELHVTSSNLRSSSIKISNLELERAQHLSALNTGLLVEKDQVTAELTRLMEKATEEAAQRGQAETAREQIEKDLDDLSAGLFGQANTMVAEARFNRAMSERKAEEAERALRETEEVVQLMQQQMQELQAEKDASERRMAEMSATMGKGKWVARSPSPSSMVKLAPRLLSSHLPYQEFLMFVAHLRTLRPNSPQVPAMSTLLPLPFLARLASEDTDPTVRLDLAPSLNWLTRRSVLSAIHSGQLSIEPISATALLESTIASQTTLPVPSSNSQSGICCALCGVSLTDGSSPVKNHTPSNSWGSSIFKDALSRSLSGPRPSSPTPSTTSPNPSRQNSDSYPTSTLTSNLPTQVYIFKLATSNTTSLPQSPTTPKAQTTVYPLCTSGWCLTRLRTTCSLWAFVRTGIVEKVWEEEIPTLPPPPPRKDSSEVNGGRPSVPPRRKSKMGMGGLWGMASALGNWGDGNSRSGSPGSEKANPLAKVGTPPPIHPSQAPAGGLKRFVAPISQTIAAPTPTPAVAAPPLPTRSRSRTIVQHSTPPPPPRSAAVASISEEASTNGDEESSMYSKASAEEALMRLRGGMASSESLASPPSSPTPTHIGPAAIETSSSQEDKFLTPTDEPSEFTVPSHPSTPPPRSASRPGTPGSKRNSYTSPGSKRNSVGSPMTPVVGRRSIEDWAPVRPPSRTGSPAPPPVPRRAAARNRPVPPPPTTTTADASAATGAEAVSAPILESTPAPAPEQTAQPPSDAAEPETSSPPSAPAPLPHAEEPIVEEPAPVTHIPLSDTQEVMKEGEKDTEDQATIHDHLPESAAAELAAEPEAKPEAAPESAHEPESAQEPEAAPQPESNESIITSTTAAAIAEVADEIVPETKHRRDESQELVFTAGSDYDSSTEPPHSATHHRDPPPLPHSTLERSTTAEELMREAEAGEHEDELHDSFAPLPPSAPQVPDKKPELPVRSRGRSGSIMQPPPPPPRRVLAPPVNGVNGTVKEEDEDEKRKDEKGVDGEAYVGDTTWEERTWKELVRLREEMFWARVGGVKVH